MHKSYRSLGAGVMHGEAVAEVLAAAAGAQVAQVSTM